MTKHVNAKNEIEIHINYTGKKVWVNVDEACVLSASGRKQNIAILKDDRPKESDALGSRSMTRVFRMIKPETLEQIRAELWTHDWGRADDKDRNIRRKAIEKITSVLDGNEDRDVRSPDTTFQNARPGDAQANSVRVTSPQGRHGGQGQENPK